MKDYNQKLNKLKEEAEDIVDSINNNEYKHALTIAFKDVDDSLEEIIEINYQLNDLVDKWLPHKKQKKELEDKEEKLYGIIDKLINNLNNLGGQERKDLKIDQIVRLIKKKVALTQDYVDDFWDEQLKFEKDRDVGDPFWRSKRRS